MITFRPPAEDIKRLQLIAASGASGLSRRAQDRLQHIKTAQLCADLDRPVPEALKR